MPCKCIGEMREVVGGHIGLRADTKQQLVHRGSRSGSGCARCSHNDCITDSASACRGLASLGKHEGAHRGAQRSRSDGLAACGEQFFAGDIHQLGLVPPECLGSQRQEEVDCRAGCKPGGVITRAHIVEGLRESLVNVVTDDYGSGLRRDCSSRPEQGAAARRIQPLVRVRYVPVGLQGRQIQWNLPDGMSAIDENRDAAAAKFGKDSFQRQDQRGRRGDVIQHHQSRSRSHCIEHAAGRCRPPASARESAPCGPRHRFAGNAPRCRGGPRCTGDLCAENFIARRQLNRTEHRQHARRGVFHQRDSFALGAEQSGEVVRDAAGSRSAHPRRLPRA